MNSSLRYFTSFAFSGLLILLGFVKRARSRILSAECILPLYFHNPTAKEFEGCIQWLIAKGFRFLSVAELEGILSKETAFPKGGVVITVDDGWKCNRENVVQIACKYDIPVTIFVSTEPVEYGIYWWSYVKEAHQKSLDHPPVSILKKLPNKDRLSVVEEIKKQITREREALTVAQIQEISKFKNITIGGHTHSHPILPHCTPAEVVEELSLSKDKLESWTGKEVSYFAYPNGDYTPRDTEILKDLDYRLAFTTRPQFLSPQTSLSRYELPRFAFWENAPFTENICRMVGIWEPIMNKLSGLAKSCRSLISVNANALKLSRFLN